MTPNEEKPTEWFEPLYKNASIDGTGVPWAHMQTQPFFKEWLDKNPMNGNGKRALVIGCGMGDDAIALEALGFKVTAFDVSKTAIEFCNKRFTESTVDFLQADLFNAPTAWIGKFDFILEIYTIQAIPPKYEDEVISIIPTWLNRKGLVLVIAGVVSQPRNFKNGPPWLLNKTHVDKLKNEGLTLLKVSIKPRAERNSELYTSLFQMK